MDTERMINELENVAEKYRNKRVFTGEVNITAMCEDVIPKLKQLKEYEDLYEQGLLLKLPCKVGDAVYVIRKHSYCPSGICKSERTCSECRENAPYEAYNKKFMIDDLKEIGKTVFLTQAEAEEAMQGIERSNAE